MNDKIYYSERLIKCDGCYAEEQIKNLKLEHWQWVGYKKNVVGFFCPKCTEIELAYMRNSGIKIYGE